MPFLHSQVLGPRCRVSSRYFYPRSQIRTTIPLHTWVFVVLRRRKSARCHTIRGTCQRSPTDQMCSRAGLGTPEQMMLMKTTDRNCLHMGGFAWICYCQVWSRVYARRKNIWVKQLANAWRLTGYLSLLHLIEESVTSCTALIFQGGKRCSPWPSSKNFKAIGSTFNSFDIAIGSQVTRLLSL